MITALEKTYVAFDQMERDEIFTLAKKLHRDINHFKIGLEVFCRYGQSFLKELANEYSCKIFLDIKLHDIPTTVARAISSLEGLPLDLINVHISGGNQMLAKALKELRSALPQTKLLGVSYLTSLSAEDLKNIWKIDEVENAYQDMFRLAFESQIDGLVLSGNELSYVAQMEKEYNHQMIKVCPGIRFQDEIAKGNIQDQKRVIPPHEALQMGADYLVMGRSLTQASHLQQRIETLRQITLN